LLVHDEKGNTVLQDCQAVTYSFLSCENMYLLSGKYTMLFSCQGGLYS